MILELPDAEVFDQRLVGLSSEATGLFPLQKISVSMVRAATQKNRLEQDVEDISQDVLVMRFERSFNCNR